KITSDVLPAACKGAMICQLSHASDCSEEKNMKTLQRFRPSRLTVLLLAGFAAAPAYSITSYPGDPGQLGDPASWRTPEYLRSYGLRSMGAEFAYAAGYAGEGVRIGLVDSGFYFGHPDLPASRFTPVAVDASTGVWNQAF